MPKQTKIKELLKDLERRVFTDFETEEPSKDIKIIGRTKLADIDSFIQLKQAVKSLRKENKAMKKDLERVRRISNWLPVNPVHFKIMGLEITKPVAEFKCAKDNVPAMKGQYLIICESEGNRFYTKCFYSHIWETAYNVIAFTETDPAEIVDALNK